MINSAYTTLDCRPKGFYRVDVGITANVLLRTVLDNLVSIAQFRNKVVARQFVSEDSAVPRDSIPNHRQERSCFYVRDYFRNSVPVTFSHAHNDCLARSASSSFSSMLTAYIRLINFYFSGKRINILIHKFANLFKHSPCRLIGNTQLPLKLFGGYTCLRGSHYKDSVEPGAERSSRFVKDSICSRRNMASAELAGIYLTPLNAVMRRDLLTFRAISTLREASFKEEIKAGIIIRELLAKIFNSVGSHLPYSNPELCLHYNTKVT